MTFDRNISPTRPVKGAAPAGWLESRERQGQIAASQTVPLEPVVDRRKARVARVDAKRANAGKKSLPPHRT